MTTDRVDIDEDAYQDLFEIEPEAEQPLDFDEEHFLEDHIIESDGLYVRDDGGRIYESIEDEIGPAADEALREVEADEADDTAIESIEQFEEI